MKSKRSRLALVGVLALALSVTVGLVSGSVADAKKKKGKGKGGSVTVALGARGLPPGTVAQPPGCIPFPGFVNSCTTGGRPSLTPVPVTVGKKAKNKVVSLDSVVVTYTLTGSPRTGAGTANDVPAAASNVGICITAPNQRTACATNPGSGDQNATTIGPVTVTPDSPFGVCNTGTTGPNGTQTICDPIASQDPENTVGPPSYAGTIGDDFLIDLGGVPAKGVWTFKFRNFGRTPATVSNFSATIGLAPSPTAKK
jgi:hypothetical protein